MDMNSLELAKCLDVHERIVPTGSFTISRLAFFRISLAVTVSSQEFAELLGRGTKQFAQLLETLLGLRTQERQRPIGLFAAYSIIRLRSLSGRLYFRGRIQRDGCL